MDLQISLTAARRRAELALEHRLIPAVDQLVRLQAVTLREAGVAYVALVRFLPGVNPQVALQLVGVGAGVRAVRTLVRPFSRVRPDVPLQLAQLHRTVVALGTFVRLLERVPVADVPHQLAGRGKCRVALLALVRAHACVRVDVVLQRRDRLEATVADVALVRPFLRVRLHVARQQVALRARVVAVVAHQLRLHHRVMALLLRRQSEQLAALRTVIVL